MSFLKPLAPTLYEIDYLQWIETTVQQLQGQNYGAVDWENVIEELADMGRSERRALKSNLIVILVHLLKWEFQSDRRSGSWEGSIIEHRRRVQEALSESPSLKPYIESILAESYVQAAKQARAETGLPITTFPSLCPYSLDQVIKDDFLP
jgi:hypothetical protein